jgi:hypothetical protein
MQLTTSESRTERASDIWRHHRAAQTAGRCVTIRCAGSYICQPLAPRLRAAISSSGRAGEAGLILGFCLQHVAQPHQQFLAVRLCIRQDTDVEKLLAGVQTKEMPGEAETAPIESEFRIRQRSGRVRILEVSATNLLKHPAVNGIVVNARDVTERERANAVIREILQMEDVKTRFLEQGIEARGTTPEEFAAQINREQPEFDDAIKAAKLQPE